MFDIGVWELAVIAVITLIVVGPERLPGIARTGGLWFGKARRFISSVKADIDKELRAEELKRIMQEQARSSGLHEIVEETRNTVESARSDLKQTREHVEAAGRTIASETESKVPLPEPDSPARRDEHDER